MKKIYSKPSIELIKVLGECVLNTGSVVTGDGTTTGSLGNGTGGGTPDGGTIWGDAKGNTNVWDDQNN